MNTRNVVSALISALALAGGCRGDERSESQRATEDDAGWSVDKRREVWVGSHDSQDI